MPSEANATSSMSSPKMFPNNRQASEMGLASSPIRWMGSISGTSAQPMAERGLPAMWSTQPTSPSSRKPMYCE